jgi:hypothetical protein
MTLFPSMPRPAIWLDRAEARRHYHDWSERLHDQIGDLHEIADRDQRAELLEAAATAVDTLSELHDPAWGPLYGDDGRMRSVSLADCAVLLRMVAATERAVIAPEGESLRMWGDPDAYAELRVWAELADAAAPGHRADLLRELADMAARRVGADAAGVLRAVAHSEAHLAVSPATPACDGVLVESGRTRLLVAALLALVGGIAMAPDLAVRVRVGLLLVVLAGFYGLLWLVDRRRRAAG